MKQNKVGLPTRLKRSFKAAKQHPSQRFQKYFSSFEVNPKEVILEKELGHGEFGVVMKGLWAGSVEIAVKQTKDVSNNILAIDGFFEEAKMRSILKHPNLVGMLGVVSQSHPYMIMTEFLSNGDLQSYLSKYAASRHIPSPTSSNTIIVNTNQAQPELSTSDLTYMALQVARGMKYLQDSKFIHRDLV